MPRSAIRTASRGDLREFPTYGISEAAGYLGIPAATLRSWTLGRQYETAQGTRSWPPLIELPAGNQPTLSFMNLVEAGALATIRRGHRIRMPYVRKAIQYLSESLHSRHPLAEKLETNGIDLFISKYGRLINLSQMGQLGIRECLAAHLRRVEHDAEGLAIRLFPWTHSQDFRSPKIIAIEPQVSFGKPVIFGTGIRTDILAERYRSGDSIAELRKDFRLKEVQVEEAIRYELLAA